MSIHDFKTGKPINPEDILKNAGIDFIDENASMNQITGFVKEVAKLAGNLEPLERAAVRELTVTHVRSTKKVNSPARLVDAAFGPDYQPAADDEAQGRAIELVEPEPADEPVDAIEMAGEITQTLQRFLILATGAATAVALWVIHTYALAYAQVSPILCINSPEKRCAKTHTLEILQCLVNKPLQTSNTTKAAIYRAIEKWTCTLLIDEADTWIKKDPELRGIINSGHRKSTATIIRTVGEDYEPRLFSTWAAKAIALIGYLHETLEDRSIGIPMQRKAPEEKVERLRFDVLNCEKEPLRRKIVRWVQDHAEQLKTASPDDLPELNDRANDNWRPLLAIADLIGGEWPEKAREAARILSGEATGPDSSARVQLLGDLRMLFDTEGDQLSSTHIVTQLGQMEDRPWPEWRHGKPITTRQLAALLKPFGVTPSQFWTDGKKHRGYTRDALEDTFRRYTPLPHPVEAVEPSTDASLDPIAHPVEQPNPTGSKKAENPHCDSILPDLPDPEGGSRGIVPPQDDWKELEP